MQITLDPKLLDLIEYDIWRSSEDNAWVCVAGRLPFIGISVGTVLTPSRR